MIRGESRGIHEKIVRYLSEVLRDKHYRDIRADLPDWAPPPVLSAGPGEGDIPDLTATSDRFNIFEVETSDSIDDGHTSKQWPLFARFARNNGGLFWLVVPPGTEKAAKRRLQELDIDAITCEVPEKVLRRRY